MTESEFLAASERVLDDIEVAVDAAGLDADFERKSTGVLELELADHSRIVINTQTPMRQIWVAAKSGGYHFQSRHGGWHDTRTGEELFTALSRVLCEQGGVAVRLAQNS